MNNFIALAVLSNLLFITSCATLTVQFPKGSDIAHPPIVYIPQEHK